MKMCDLLGGIKTLPQPPATLRRHFLCIKMLSASAKDSCLTTPVKFIVRTDQEFPDKYENTMPNRCDMLHASFSAVQRLRTHASQNSSRIRKGNLFRLLTPPSSDNSAKIRQCRKRQSGKLCPGNMKCTVTGNNGLSRCGDGGSRA
ncbi:hypothetical protein PUN28_017969 [Cardiocondyla obscurior]|uniref:Uncharacterized protein n=1 Tax=Cardiocondyla obscurior TaxID=286306 RepID=A0AAW2EGR5_9HYME